MLAPALPGVAIGFRVQGWRNLFVDVLDQFCMSSSESHYNGD